MLKQSGWFLLLLVGLFPGVILTRETPADRLAIIVSDLADTELIQLSSWIAASPSNPLFLMDGPVVAGANRDLLARWNPGNLTGVGGTARAKKDLELRLDRKLNSFLEWNSSARFHLLKKLFPQAEQVVICPISPRPMLLQGAWLAGIHHAPLLLIKNIEDPENDLKEWLAANPVRKAITLGQASKPCRTMIDGINARNLARNPPEKAIEIEELADEETVAAAGRTHLQKNGLIHTLLITNPADVHRGLGRMSQLAPWFAASKNAAMVFSNEKGDNATAVLKNALGSFDLRQTESLIILAGLKAIPTEHRLNPVQGKDAEIEMEPMTPTGNETFTLATGRLFHEFPGMVLVQVGRSRVLPPDGMPRHALVVSNPGGGLPLLETFSRHTTNELRNAGYATASMFGPEADSEKMRKLLPQQDIFLWEGHYRTLIDDFGFLTWTERLPPALYFLQSCLALKEDEASPLFQRGAFAIVGTSTRTYSGTGGAFSVAFFDAMAYDNQTLGGALRQAKNFLVCYTLLKEKRIGEKARLTGVNVRSAWAFTLWGDPTLRLPRPSPSDNAITPVRHEVRGNSIHFFLPGQSFDPVKVSKYNATMLPNGRLAGLLTLDEDEDEKHLVPFVFAEVPLPSAPLGKKPRLTSRINDRSYVFNWDPRRRVVYLLVTPRTPDLKEFRFKVDWVD